MLFLGKKELAPWFERWAKDYHEWLLQAGDDYSKTDATSIKMEIPIPSNGYWYSIDRGGCQHERGGCQHERVDYQGFSESYRFCKHCDQKENK